MMKQRDVADGHERVEARDAKARLLGLALGERRVGRELTSGDGRGGCRRRRVAAGSSRRGSCRPVQPTAPGSSVSGAGDSTADGATLCRRLTLTQPASGRKFFPRDYTFPIPQSEIDLNPNLKAQNGW